MLTALISVRGIMQSLQGELDQLILKYEAIRDERIARFQEEQGEETGEEKIVEVPFTAANGVTKVDCTINGLPLNFVFDKNKVINRLLIYNNELTTKREITVLN